MTWIWAAALLLFGVSLVYAGLGGVRGADQYWYVADVETLITSGQNQTNNIFPVTLLSGQRIPPPFVHNILSLYLAALPALFLGSFWGWLALNLVSTLLCCYLIYKTCMRVTNTLFAQLASLFYLLFPVTLWQTSQPLAEASIAALVALGLYLLACADNGLRSWLAVASAAGLSYLARESLVLLLIAVPLGYVACGLSERGQRWWRVTSAGRQLAILMAVCLAFIGVGKILFENIAVEMSYARVLNSSVPNRTDSMFLWFDLSEANLQNKPPITMEILILKLTGGLARQFVEFDNPLLAGFHWIFNTLTLITLAMLWRVRKKPLARRMVWATSLLIAVHFATIVMHLNQLRYLLLPMPGMLIVLALGLAEWRAARGWSERYAVAAAGAVLMVAAPVQLLLANHAHDQGRAENKVVAAAAQVISPDIFPGEAALVSYTGRSSLLLGYALRPRPVLYFREDYTQAQYRRLLSELPSCCRWLVATADSPVLANLGVAPGAMIASLPPLHCKSFKVFELATGRASPPTESASSPRYNAELREAGR